MSQSFLWGHALLVLSIVVAAAVGHLAPRTIGVVLVVLSVWWLRANKRFEYGVVFSLNSRHGAVVSDFVSLGGFLAAVYLWGLWWWRVRHRAERERRPQ